MSLMSRYTQLASLIDVFRPSNIIEIGTWNGEQGVAMVRRALQWQEKVTYVGYDLFEYATSATDAREFNVKPHAVVGIVESRFEECQARYAPGRLQWRLVKGDTRQTLHGKHITGDFVFLDGGHSVETIRGDYEAVASSQIVVFDDYYEPEQEGGRVGCNRIISGLVGTMLPIADSYVREGQVRMVLVCGALLPRGESRAVSRTLGPRTHGS